MKEINWDEAPADAIGIGQLGLSKLTVWVGEGWYQYTDADVVEPGKRFSFSETLGNTLAWSKGELSDFVGRPTVWNGDGLPPIGSKVEFYSDDFENEDYWNKDLTNESEVEIIAHIASSARQDEVDLAVFVFQYSNGDRQVEQATSCCFRPLKTEEQLEEEAKAQERDKTLSEMVTDLGAEQPRTREYIICGILYDAGYRKVEQENE